MSFVMPKWTPIKDLMLSPLVKTPLIVAIGYNGDSFKHSLLIHTCIFKLMFTLHDIFVYKGKHTLNVNIC